MEVIDDSLRIEFLQKKYLESQYKNILGKRLGVYEKINKCSCISYWVKYLFRVYNLFL